mmetsp:Transcript_4410/g.28130  ORF Transcript_4410/g.28130 Transcript_4410/m.28130 type:complete len:219 (-) Transcript_4410:847-1503(-)
MPKCLHPTVPVHTTGLRTKVTSLAHLKNSFSTHLATHHGCVNAFSSKRVDVACCISNNQKVVIKACLQSLASQAQAGCPHPLHLRAIPNGTRNVRVFLQSVIVQPCQVCFRNITTHAIFTAWNQVVTEVQDIIGMLEDGAVSRKRLTLVEAYTIEISVVGRFNKCTRTNSFGWFGTVAQFRGQPGGGTVGADQHTRLEGPIISRVHSPKLRLFVKLCI